MTTILELGVWGVVWVGRRTLREGYEATLDSMRGMGGNYEDGWVEQWRVTDDWVLQFFRDSPSEDGWRIRALGMYRCMGDARVEDTPRVVEVWTKGQDISREEAMLRSGIDLVEDAHPEITWML